MIGNLYNISWENEQVAFEAIQRAKSIYNRNLLRENSNDPKKFWKTFKSIYPTKGSDKPSMRSFDINGVKTSNPRTISNAFCTFFASVVKSLKKKAIPLRDFIWRKPAGITKRTEKSFLFQSVSQLEVLRILKSIKRNKATGLDDLPPCLLKDSAAILSAPLAHLINLSITTGIFPMDWKKAKIIPVHKSGPFSVLDNYRPISILPVISKIIEKAIHRQLITYLDQNALLSQFQFGFRPKLSTELAATHLLDNIRKSVDDGKLVGAVFIDLSKAFDTISHSKLLEKLPKYGIDGKEYAWFKDYLFARKAVVSYNNCVSDEKELYSGAPQGSILGPLLFIMLFNDITDAIRHSRIVKYADDTVIYFADKDSKSIQSNLTEDMDLISNWLKENELIINMKEGKTEALLFGTDMKHYCLELAKTRDKLKSQAVKGNSKLLMECYKQIRYRVNNMNTQLKRKYFSEKLTQFQGDLKKTWKTINQVINKKSGTTVVPCLTVDGQTVRGHKDIASSMNEYFCSVGNKLSEKIPKKANPLLSGEYAIETPPLSFSFSAIMTDKLSSTLNKMKTSHGSGHDGIASFYLKIALPVVGGSLCDLFNKSLFAGKFPEDWKIARIAPIFKSGAKDDRSNYRPISVLPFISRLFEKLIFNQFYEYLDANKSLYEHQSGFRLLHSVATALMASTNDWYLNIDNRKYTGLIFIDLKKAFDTVDHEILLEKLKMYGVTDLEHDWFTSYLDNRKQFCRINGSSSDVKGINCGVPQGSCLGPLLFLIYINDLPFSLQKSHVSMYADDTTISLSSKSIGDLQNDLNLDLLKLQDWLHANKLSLNVVKTQSLIIGSGPNIRKIESQPDAQPSFSIGDQEIEMIANAKYLGVQVDSQLNWDKHVDTIKTKANRALGLIKYSKKYLPSDVLNKMYRGIVEPHLSYCSSVWGCCSNSKINVLQKIQNRAARIVTNSPYDASAAPLIQNLGWPTINNLIRKETATLTYKSLNSLAPVYMRKLFTKYSDDRERSLRSTETDLRLPLLKTVNGQKAFSYRGAKLWNSLEKEAKLAPSLKTFKERL